MSASASPLLTQQTDSSTVIKLEQGSPLTSSPLPSHSHPSIPILTGLRGVLCFWILLHNLQGASSYVPNSIAPAELVAEWMVTSGSSAVSMFFVLSGFVLLYSYGTHAFDGWRSDCTLHFLMKRYARLVPLYWISTAMAIGVEVNSVNAGGWDGWSVAHWMASALGCNTWWPWPLYRTGPAAIIRGLVMFNPSLWSIQTELGFYLTLPFLVRALRYVLGLRTLRHLTIGSGAELESRFIRMSGLFLLFTITGIIPTIILVKDSTLVAFVYLMPWFRLSEFILGMLTCTLYFLLIQARTPDVQSELPSSSYLKWVSASSFLFSRVTLDVAVVGLSVCFVALGRSGWDQQLLAANPGSYGTPLTLLLLLMALTHSPLSMQPAGITAWLLTRPCLLLLGVLSFAFYTFHLSAVFYAESLQQPVNLSIPLNLPVHWDWL